MKPVMRPVRLQVFAVVIVCTPAQWDEIRSQFDTLLPGLSQGREYLSRTYGMRRVVFLRAGDGLVATAAATQFAIDRWKPSIVMTTSGLNGELEAAEAVGAINGSTVLTEVVGEGPMSELMPPVLDSAAELLVSQKRTR